MHCHIHLAEPRLSRSSESVEAGLSHQSLFSPRRREQRWMLLKVFLRSTHLWLQSAKTKGKCARLLLNIIEESYSIADRETSSSTPPKEIPSGSPDHQVPRGYFVLSENHWMVTTVPVSPVCDWSRPSIKAYFLLRRMVVHELGIRLSL